MECLSPIYLAQREVHVPCGSCPFCCATKRSDWALRLNYEARLHCGSKFITLTYADNELTWNSGQPQLVKRDLQLFFKRLRKKGYKLRYFAVGEYGSKTFRPHYHVIVFGSIPDQVLNKAWGKGHVHIGKVTAASVMYCCGYVVNGKSWQMKRHRLKPFALMSRRPGLGHNYLSGEMIAWHKSDRKNYAILHGQKRHLPRYYKDKIFSKLDKIKMMVRDEKEHFKKMLRFIRHPSRMMMRDPLKYYEEQRQRLAKTIRFKSKQNLTI